MSKEATLEPCPFCLGEADIERSFVQGHQPKPYVLCGECGSATNCYDTEAEAIAAWNRRIAATRPNADNLFAAIAHGDETHRAWLEQAIKDHFAGRPVQPSVGNGRKDAMAARIAELEAENANLSKAVCSGILKDLLEPDETDALVDFIKFLREQKPALSAFQQETDRG